GARGRAPGRAPLERDDHVRPRRAAGALGAPPAARTGAAGADGRVPGARATGVRPDGGADLPPGPRTARADVRRGPAAPRRRAARVARVDREHPGELG